MIVDHRTVDHPKAEAALRWLNHHQAICHAAISKHALNACQTSQALAHDKQSDCGHAPLPQFEVGVHVSLESSNPWVMAKTADLTPAQWSAQQPEHVFRKVDGCSLTASIAITSWHRRLL
jgi:hypothetical protein